MSITGSEQLSPISVEDYLAGELQARRKHEYVDGQIYAGDRLANRTHFGREIGV